MKLEAAYLNEERKRRRRRGRRGRRGERRASEGRRGEWTVTAAAKKEQQCGSQRWQRLEERGKEVCTRDKTQLSPQHNTER